MLINRICLKCGKLICEDTCKFCGFNQFRDAFTGLDAEMDFPNNKDNRSSSEFDLNISVKHYPVNSDDEYDHGELDISLAIIDWFGDQTSYPDETAFNEFYNALDFVGKNKWEKHKVYQLIETYIDNNNLIFITSDKEKVKSSKTSCDVSFFMSADDCFLLSGRGTAVAGRVLFGRINSGDKVDIINKDGKSISATIKEIEMFHHTLPWANSGDYVDVIFHGINKADIIGAQAVVNQYANAVHKRFRGSLYLLKKEEGGGYLPVFNYFKPCLHFAKKDLLGLISFAENDAASQLTKIGGILGVMLTPGNSAGVLVEFDTPTAIFKGMQFDVHRGNSVTIAKLTVEAPED